ncbi:MAG: hypothetical protein ACRD2X_23030 [Vicinamibacteraceae bacterium]
MPDRPTADERLDIVIDRGVRSLVERDAPPGHVARIRTRLAGRSRWAQPALMARPKRWSYMTAALLVVAIAAGVWTLRESRDDALETRVVTKAPLQASPMLDVRSATRENVAALRPLPPPALPSPEADEARKAEASRAKLMAYLDALYQLPPEVLLRKPPSAGEQLSAPRPIVVPEIVIAPLNARMESEDDALPNDSPRGEE